MKKINKNRLNHAKNNVKLIKTVPPVPISSIRKQYI